MKNAAMIAIIGLLTFSCSVRSPLMGYSAATFDAKSFDKVGESSAIFILGVFPTGDYSIDAAMKNGGIAHIHHIDHETQNYLLYSVSKTIVYGEDYASATSEKVFSTIDIGKQYTFQLQNGNSIKGTVNSKLENLIIIIDVDGNKQILKKSDLISCAPITEPK